MGFAFGLGFSPDALKAVLCITCVPVLTTSNRYRNVCCRERDSMPLLETPDTFMVSTPRSPMCHSPPMAPSSARSTTSDNSVCTASPACAMCVRNVMEMLNLDLDSAHSAQCTHERVPISTVMCFSSSFFVVSSACRKFVRTHVYTQSFRVNCVCKLSVHAHTYTERERCSHVISTEDAHTYKRIWKGVVYEGSEEGVRDCWDRGRDVPCDTRHMHAFEEAHPYVCTENEMYHGMVTILGQQASRK